MAHAVRLSVASRKNDTNERLIKRFLRKAQNAGIVEEARERAYFTGTKRAKRKQRERRG